jgi:hypothetical protein
MSEINFGYESYYSKSFILKSSGNPRHHMREKRISSRKQEENERKGQKDGEK